MKFLKILSSKKIPIRQVRHLFTMQFYTLYCTISHCYYHLDWTINSSVVSLFYKSHQTLILNITKTVAVMSIKIWPTIKSRKKLTV